MQMNDLRAIIIDDNKDRREKVSSILPDYIASVGVGFGEGALDYLKRDGEGVLPDVVIMYGDDPKSYGLYIYDWMLNKSGDAGIAAIPVIVLTEDEFSDRSLEFLELGDVVFYEGEIDESNLFSVINEAIEYAEFMPDPVEPVYEENKSIDRLMGQSVKAPEEGGRHRAVVLDMETRLDNLEAALARGKKRANDIRTLLDSASAVKGAKENKNKPSVSGSENNNTGTTSFLDKAKKNKNIIKQAAHDDGAAVDSIEKLQKKAMTNPYGALNAQGTLKYHEAARQQRYQEDTRRNVVHGSSNGKPTVVIVDTDVKTRKLCSLFLTQKYNVISLDSGIKTIDFFVKNRADLLIINPILAGMSGVDTVRSVHMQPGGAYVPVMYLVGDDYTEARTRLLGPNVVGILNKPIKQGLISQSVEGFFDSRGQGI